MIHSIHARKPGAHRPALSPVVTTSSRRCSARNEGRFQERRVMRAVIARMKDDRGLTTAEYAVGTVGAVGIAGILIKILTSEEAKNLIWGIMKTALSVFL